MSLFSQKNLVPLSLFLFIFVTCPQLFSQPIAILTASQSQGLGPLTIDFDARDSFDPSGANLSYDWQFGDGAIGSGNQITHTYSNFGNYQCRLIVSNPSGQMDTSILAIQTFGAGNWIEWSDCPEKRVENGYVQAGDKFYLIGGLTIGGNFTNQLKMMAHDPLTDSWSYLGDMPYRFHHLQAVELDGLIYVVSSWIAPNPNNTSNDSIYIYDPLVDTWVSGREIPFSRKRGSAATVVHNGKIYVAGGNEGGHGVQGDVKNYFDVYDPRIGSFDSLPDLPHARDHVYGTIWGDKLYMAAGRNSGAPNFLDSTVAEVDVFDFNTASWSDLGSLLPTERSGAPVVSMDGKIIVIGGEVQDEQRALKTLEAYDLGTNQWINLQDLSTGMHATPGIVNNGSIYLAGGSEWRGAANKTNKTKVFISDGGNTPAPPILTPISAGNLTANTSEINFSSTLNGDSTTEVLYLRNKGGNQGIIIERFELNTSLSQISLLDSFTFPIVIPPNDSLGINIQYKAGPSNPVAGSIEVSRSDPYVDQSIPFGGFKPSPIFKYERQNNLTPLIFEFDATASYDNDGSIAEYEWDYGDGNMGQGSISTHTYTQNGIYAVKLIITDSQGLQDSLTRMLEVAT
ncbi:MAG: PKD domain-containing protein, partial [Bacteroidota bacterium]